MATSLRDLLPVLARLSKQRDASTSLQTLSDDFGRSPAHFQCVFSRLVGGSPKRYSQRLRLERASTRLLHGNQCILDLALDAGFESHEGFTRAFRRHFGLSPREYRTRGLLGESARTDLHARVTESVGPCIGLYRAPLHHHERPLPMSYTVTRRTMEEIAVLYKTKSAPLDKIGEALGEILPEVFAYATKAGVPLMGPPFSRYVSMSPGSTTIEAGMPVGEGATAEGEIELGVIAAGPVAVTTHTGPYEGLSAAHAAIEKWIEENDLEASGSPWESYITDPGEVPDPAEWQTEVFRPLAS